MEEDEEEHEEEHDVFGASDDAMKSDERQDSVPVGRMGLPIRPRMSRASASDSGRPTGRNRRSSVFEENAFHEILKERLHDTILQVVHTDKSELEEEDDEVFEEPLMWKPSLVKQRLANTFRMVPDREFDFAAVAKRINEALQVKFKHKEFETKQFKALTLSLSDDVRSIAKELTPERFKIIVRVFMGELKNQGLTIASRFLWDPEHDSWCESQFQTTSFFVVVTVYAVYFE